MPDNENTTLTSMEDLMEQTGAGTSADLDLAGTSNVPYDEELDAPIIGQQYLAKFHDLKDHEDELEERESSVVSQVHFVDYRGMNEWIAKGYEKITVEEQNALVDGGVRRKSDHAIVPRPPIIIPLSQKIDSLIYKINDYTASVITGGFISEVTSGPNPGSAKFDSSKEDQNTFSMCYAASLSPDFETSEYRGMIPCRGYRVVPGGFEPEKEVFYLNAENMQRLMDNLARHTGQAKIQGWSLQELAKSATEETYDEIEAQIYEAIGYNPEPELGPNAE